MLKEIIGEYPERVERLREEMTSGPVTETDSYLVSHYRRGVQLCMRYSYWKSMKVSEGAVFCDASGCVWTAAQDQGDHQADMLVMRTAQDIPVASLPSLKEDESWLRAMGFLDALDYLQSH